MSTRQRPMHETTVEPAAVAPLLLARAAEPPAPLAPISLAEDIGARRLRELAARLTGGDLQPNHADDDGDLDESDTEFEPVSLSTILALGRTQTSDLHDGAPIDTIIGEPQAGRLAVQAARELLPAPASENTAAPPVALTADVPPMGLLSVAPLVTEDEDDDELADATVEITALQPEEHGALAAVIDAEEDAARALYEPLLLSDQSTPDIRLVDLIRRQQSMLDQLNSFPPSYEALEKQAAANPPAATPATPPARSVIEQLAPPPAPPAAEPTRETPLALAQLANIRREPRLQPPSPSLASSLASSLTQTPQASRDEPDESELPQQSPIIIQRAMAERSGRRAPVVAAPPSAVPAFLMGLAAALVFAGVLFAVL